uniref:OCRE domain-containing protein n=1 Tax=Lactuca sativa TaxID=4236 RepID=A0A9R1XDZ9_LACSA|nr:hypothetical protein LSAT_V11C400207540 [Lactuca sativa]
MCFNLGRQEVLQDLRRLKGRNKQPNSSRMSDSGLNGIPSVDNIANNEDDSFDIFAEDGDKSTVDPSDGIGSTENDYVFDESSGYYYSSSLGYYYDPSSGLYWSVHVTKKMVPMRSCHQGKAMEMELQHSGMELESQHMDKSWMNKTYHVAKTLLSLIHILQ